jgi:aspartyl-tRNA(Asn)/glutamyl-tRNA(Gln) amidotransferase subunit B
MVDLTARLNKEDREISESPVSAEQLGGLLARIGDGTISTNIARKVFDALWSGEGSSADEIIARQDLQQISDSGSLETLLDELLAANPAMVAEFRAGKEKAFNALVGQAMKATRGKANPQRVSDLLRKKLG